MVFEKSTNNLGESIIRLGMTDVGLDMAGIVVISNGEGFFLMAPDGIAGRLSADVALNVPGVTFQGTFGIAINTTPRAIQSSIMLGNDTLVLDLPMGKYLRVEGTDVTLGIGGVVLSGDFGFEQITTGDGQDNEPGTPDDLKEVRIFANNVSLPQSILLGRVDRE